jgi:hypothetical protein
MTVHRGPQVSTVNGILLLGEYRERHSSDTRDPAGRFGGTDKSRIVDDAERCLGAQ